MFFYVAEMYALIGESASAMRMLTRAVAQGFFCVSALERDPYLAPLRALPEWRGLIERARDGQERVVAIFEEQRGAALLGL
jgi:hypothetical protein